MKRVTLNIDLNENTIFEKEVIELIKAKSREIARDNQVSIIEETVSQEIKRLFSKDFTGSYKSDLKKLVEQKIAMKAREELDRIDIRSIVNEEMQRQIEVIISQTTAKAQEECILALNRVVTREVSMKLVELLKQNKEGE